MASMEFLVGLSALNKILLGSSLVVSLFVLRAIFKAVVSPLRHVPGPFWARFSRTWYWRVVWRGDFEKTNIELHKKYGEKRSSLHFQKAWICGGFHVS